MKRNILFLTGVLSSFIAFAQTAPTAFVGCPNVNTAILRSGTNAATTNPVSIYSVNSITGTPTLLSGPILNPANTSTNLQINGLGLNSTDGFLYGLYADVPTIAFSLPIVPAFPFYRVGANAVAVQLGTLSGPATTGFENASFVNSAAGEIDQTGNYYFSAAAGVGVPNFANPTASTFTVTRIFIGKQSGIGLLTGGTSALSPSYVEITTTDPNTAAYLASIKTTVALSTAQNTGLRDLIYNKFDNNLYTYVTFPVNAANPSAGFYGQMLKVVPATGVLTAIAAPVVLPFASATSEVAGTLIDNTGNFLILFTDGKIYKAGSTSVGVFDGSIAILNSSTGLPTTLRGDMASCGAGPDGGPLPVTLSSFNAFKQNSNIVIKWQTASELNTNRFIVETSTNGTDWNYFSQVTAQGNSANGATYQVIDNKNFNSPVVYYRLQIIDNNGFIRYSNIKKITLNNSFEFSTYPNPVKNDLKIVGQEIFSPRTDVMIIDAMGKTYRVSSKKITDNIMDINLANFGKGVYYIHLTTETGSVSTKRFIKL